MCNYLHKKHELIPEEGLGWKVVAYKNRRYHPVMTTVYQEFGYEKDKWITFKTHLGGGEGFCFFLSYEEACKYVGVWSDYFPSETPRIVRIEYKSGLGKHVETGIASTPITHKPIEFKIALCKQFKIIQRYE